MSDSPSVWLLSDDRLSHRSQVEGVAERFGFPWFTKDIRYNGFAKLANGPFGARLWHLSPESRKGIAPPWPDIVIAAGRRSAPVALAIKKRSPATRLVHLMWPDVAPTRFSLIAVPELDRLSYRGANLLRTFGAPNTVSPFRLATEAAGFQPQAARLPSPRIAVLIGGNSKDVQYTPEDFKMLAAYVSAEAERLGGSLLITSSPRTGEASETLFKSILTAPHVFFPCRAGQYNPYLAFLGLADAIVVTGDSVSMCTEACTTGKPVYIFVPPHLSRDKDSFKEVLFARGHAKHHTYPIRLNWAPEPMPNAAGQVAQAMRSLFFTG